MPSAQDVWLDHLQAATHYNQWIFSQIQPHLKGRTLEVGCGVGNLTELIAQGCSDLVAVDLNPEYAELTSSRLRHYHHVQVLTADATKMDYDQRFDTIILLDVLEHIEDDVTLLQQLQQCLLPGGNLVLKVPALDYLYNSLDKAVGHYRRYTRETLQAALSKASFAESQITYFNMVGIFGWWLNGTVLHRVTPPDQQLGWFDRCVPLFQSMESKLDCPVGLSLVAVAPTPNF